MKLVCLILVLFISSELIAQTKTQVERINFFPSADAFGKVGYEYERLKIDTPQTSVMTKEVNNYKSILSIAYAHRFGRKLYIGLNAFIEEASENVVYYGIPLKRRFNSIGPREPEFFLDYRLRDQNETKGLIDLHLSFSPKMKAREIGNSHSSPWNGRSIFQIGMSHGMWEEEWEFRSSLEYTYHGQGEEENGFDDQQYVLENYNDFIFNFKTQYRISRWLFVFGAVGIEYHGSQVIKQRAGDERVIQAGTGSLFEVGIKKPFSEWTVLELSYLLKRNDYFVKAPANNLEGDQSLDRIALILTTAF